jgi:hypothetical protein
MCTEGQQEYNVPGIALHSLPENPLSRFMHSYSSLLYLFLASLLPVVVSS